MTVTLIKKTEKGEKPKFHEVTYTAYMWVFMFPEKNAFKVSDYFLRPQESINFFMALIHEVTYSETITNQELWF